MAPEVFDEQLAEPGADDHAIGVSTDLYSLGVVAYVLVTGKVPFFGRTPNAVAFAQVNRPPPPPRLLRSDLPEAVEAVMLRQLAKKPGDRYRSARAFVAALAEVIPQADLAGAAPAFRTAQTILPMPTAITAPATPVPTAVPPTATPVIAQAPPTPAGPTVEQQADETLAQALALVADPTDANADLAVEKLDKLYRELQPESTKRPVVEEVMVRVLLEDSQRRVRAAFTLKNANEGRESQKILGDARQRFDRAAQIRPNDATIQDRVNQGREQAELTSLWVEFDSAYYAKKNDAQIAALTRIIAKKPDYRTAEGPAKEKLYAAWIARAEEAWGAQQLDLARAALDEAAAVDPDHPRARELRVAWFPPRPVAPVRAAQPRRAPASSGPVQVGASAAGGPVSVPESQPVPAAQPRPQRLTPQDPFVTNEINSPNVSNQSISSN